MVDHLDQLISNWLDGLEWGSEEPEQLTLFKTNQINHVNTTSNEYSRQEELQADSERQ